MVNEALPLSVPATLMRGGTSRGLYFDGRALSDDPAERDRIVLATMGIGDPQQIDGIGGGTTLTNKVAVVRPSESREADVDYLFIQVRHRRGTTDTAPSCGNILAGVAPFAIERGMVPAEHGVTRVRVRLVNTGGLVEAVVRTPGGMVCYSGETAIDGVPGTAAPIVLSFLGCVGGKTGAMLPSGRPTDIIEGTPATLIDVGVPMMLVRAEALGKTGYESPQALDADAALAERMERMRLRAGELMGLGDVSETVLPKVALVSPPRAGGAISSRYFTPRKAHSTHAVLGAICVTAAALVPGTVAASVAHVHWSEEVATSLEHPAGRLDVAIRSRRAAGSIAIESASLVRTARPIFTGSVLVPAA